MPQHAAQKYSQKLPTHAQPSYNVSHERRLVPSPERVTLLRRFRLCDTRVILPGELELENTRGSCGSWTTLVTLSSPRVECY